MNVEYNDEHNIDIMDTSVNEHKEHCCVCFEDIRDTSEILSLLDISEEDIRHDMIIKSACNIHYICIKCLYRIVIDYTNHPINEINSHVYCPYPFEDCITMAGTKNIFEHHAIMKILNKEEKEQFMIHAERFAFPGFTVISCPCMYYGLNVIQIVCNFPILVENELIVSADVGDLIVQCHQNEKCCKTFCYHCRGEISRYEKECRTCKLFTENTNPNLFNRYIIKDGVFDDDITYNDFGYNSEDKQFSEHHYLYYNKEITIDIALEYLNHLINNNVHYVMCPICKIHLYKTERCNGMKHHNIERCYACGRIGSIVGGIHTTHWNSTGINGCFRFDYDTFVKNYVPEYKCNPNCQNHDTGDCTLDEHNVGVQKLNKMRQKAIIYHCIKSLLPIIRYNVLDILYETYMNVPTAYELLPYKQSFMFIENYKDTILDYCEETLYEHLDIKHPAFIPEFIDKSRTIDTQFYLHNYVIPPPTPPPTPPPMTPLQETLIQEQGTNTDRMSEIDLESVIDEEEPLIPERERVVDGEIRIELHPYTELQSQEEEY